MGSERVSIKKQMFATANGAAGDVSDMDGLSREAETSGSESVNLSVGGFDV